MRKASQQPNPSLASRPSRTKRRHSEVEEDTPTSGGRGLFSTIKKFIRGNAVKVTITSDDPGFYLSSVKNMSVEPLLGALNYCPPPLSVFALTVLPKLFWRFPVFKTVFSTVLSRSLS